MCANDRLLKLRRGGCRLFSFFLTALCLIQPGFAQEADNPEESEDVVIIAPGDLLRISLREDPDVGFDGRVSAAGTVPIPYLGEFAIADFSHREAEKALSRELEKELYTRATVSITLIKKTPGQVFVYGAVRKPGVVNMPEVGTLTILQLISLVDGITTWAAPAETFILRRGRPGQPARRMAVNLAQIFETGLPFTDADVLLRANDIVCIPSLSGGLFQFMSADKCEIIVVGEVNKPGVVTFEPGEERTLIRAVFKAGGFTKFAKESDVRMISYSSGKTREEKVINAALIVDQGHLDRDVSLSPGDMLIVPQKRINF